MRRAAGVTEPFAVADELTCYFDCPSEPANVHLEVRLPGRLDQDALRSAVTALLGAEPGLRARRTGGGRWQRRYRWDFAARPDADPVLTSRYGDQADLDHQRDAFVSLPPPLDAAPPFLLLLASGPGGDCLLLNAHHARFDGLACLRLLNGLAAAYGRQVRGPQPVTGQGARRVPGPGEPGANRGASQGVTGRAGRAWPGRPGRPRRPGGPVIRIAPGQGLGGRPPRPGYGAFLLTLERPCPPDPPDTAGGAGASVNDLLITALMLAIADWNASRGTQTGRGAIRITMPVGDRAQAGPGGTWANRSRLASVSTRPGPSCEPAALLAEVARQTRLAKRRAGPQVDALSTALTAAPAPVAAKRAALRAALRIAGPALCDTALLSNLGQAGPLAFGDLAASELWFSTSAHLPRGLSVGAVTSAGGLRITFRYRRALLARADAAEFAARFGKALDELTSARVVG